MAFNPAESAVPLGRADTGEAVVLRPDAETAVDYFARLQANQNKIKHDNQDAALRALDSLKVWSVDQPHFAQRRKEYIQTVTDAMKGKYTNDPEYIKKINLLQDEIIAEAALSNETKAIHDAGMTAWANNPEMYPLDANDQGTKYRNTPMRERPLDWRMKQLDNTDYFSKIQSRPIPMAEQGDFKILPSGEKVSYTSRSYDRESGWKGAQLLAQSNEDPVIRGLKKHLAMGDYATIEPGIPGFDKMSPEEQEKIIRSPQMNQAAATYIDAAWEAKSPSKYSRRHTNAPAERATNLGKSYADMVKEGVITEDYPVNTVVYEKDGKESPGVTHVKDFMPLSMSKSTNVLSNNKFLDFDTNKYFSGEVGQYEFKPKGVGFIKDKKTGRYEAYSIGEATEINIGRRSKTVKTTYTNIAVPFNQVANAVAQDKNPIEWVQERSNELNKTNKKSDLTNVKDKAKGKTVVKKGYKRDANGKVTQTQLIYSDGTKETVNGQR